MNTTPQQISIGSIPVVLFFAILALSGAARGDDLKVNPDHGNNTFTAVFDAPLGERITAVSSSVACDISYDDRAGTASGRCSVPLTTIMVDNEKTKTDHFRDWATNKKSKPQACTFEAKFTDVKLSEPLAPEKAVKFSAEAPFTVCGRSRSDGAKERVEGTAVLVSPESKTIRIRAHVPKFNRDAYKIGPKYTDGWLARVQSLAKVVAEEGEIELTLFARPSDSKHSNR
jgi:hypothetical protein